MTPRIKWLLVGGLLLIWGTLLLFDYLEEPQTQRVSLTDTTRVSSGVTQRNKSSLFALDNSRSTNHVPVKFTKPRNIFAPLGFANTRKKEPLIQPKKPQVAPPPLTTKQPILPPSGPSPDERSAQRARQQLHQYQFLGYVIQEGEKQVFLSNGQAIYIVKQGDTLEDNISIQSVRPNKVTLSKPIGVNGLIVETTLILIKDGNGA